MRADEDRLATMRPLGTNSHINYESSVLSGLRLRRRQCKRRVPALVNDDLRAPLKPIDEPCSTGRKVSSVGSLEWQLQVTKDGSKHRKFASYAPNNCRVWHDRRGGPSAATRHRLFTGWDSFCTRSIIVDSPAQNDLATAIHDFFAESASIPHG